MLQLEKYHGIKSRHTCPNCNARREFARYVDGSGNYLSSEVGKCNRESKCGYHYKPKDFFRDNANFPKPKKAGAKKTNRFYQVQAEKTVQTAFDKMDFNSFSRTLGNYEQNGFVRFLCDLFRDDCEAVQKVIERYLIGTWQDGLTVFWQIDGRGKIRTGKIMRYCKRSGKRQTVRTWTKDGETCELKTDWMHGKIKKDFRLKQCFFGEHLLQKEPNKTVAITEAEKTAIIASIVFPEMVWLAVGAKGYLTLERFQVLHGRKVLLYPDGDCITLWKEKALEAQRNGFNVRISTLIETHGTEDEKENGFDLADYLIGEQKQRNEYNLFVDAYNSAVDNLLNDESLMRDFETMLDERKAVMMFDGKLSEAEADSYLNRAENLRTAVLSCV